jgi:hypothetical protein
MTRTDVDDVVSDYLRRLNAALGPLPKSRRELLVAEIKEHVDEARSSLTSQTEGGVRELLERLGEPEDIAAEALADQPDDGHRRFTRKLFAGMLGLIVLLGVVIGLAVRLAGEGGHTTPNSRTGRPAASRITVPNLVGTTETDATVGLQSLGLNATFVSVSDTSLAVGDVVAQTPLAGSRIERGQAVTLSVSSPSYPTSPTAPAGITVPSGMYVDGTSGTPHYFVSLSDDNEGFSGSVNFVYQDGQSSVVFTFVGTAQNGAATLRPTSVPQNAGSASQEPSTVPSVISVSIDKDSFNLGECTGYLHFTRSLAQCVFTYSPGGVQ